MKKIFILLTAYLFFNNATFAHTPSKYKNQSTPHNPYNSFYENFISDFDKFITVGFDKATNSLPRRQVSSYVDKKVNSNIIGIYLELDNLVRRYTKY